MVICAAATFLDCPCKSPRCRPCDCRAQAKQVYDPVHCAPGTPPKAHPEKLLPTTKRHIQKQRPACKRPLYANSRQGKTLQRTRVCLVLESALPISNPIARGMPPVPGVARAVKIKSSQINRNRTNQLRAEDASRFPLPASRFPLPAFRSADLFGATK